GTAALLASSPYKAVGGGNDVHNASIYQATSGAWVFGSGSQAWAWGLTRPGYTNAGIQQATQNILTKFMSNGPVSTATPTPTLTPTPTFTPTSTATATWTPTAAPTF